MARQAFDFIAANMTKGDRLGHSWRAGKLTFPGLASDFAAMIRAALALHEATGERAYLERALTWQRAFDAHYADPDTGGYYLSADDADDLLLRPHSTGRRRHAQSQCGGGAKSAAAGGANGRRRLARQGRPADRGHPVRGRAQSVRAYRAAQCARSAPARRRDRRHRAGAAERFAQAALKLPFLDRIVLRAASAADLPASHPAQEKLKAAADSAAFVCVGERCSLPVTEPGQIAEAVKAMRS